MPRTGCTPAISRPLLRRFERRFGKQGGTPIVFNQHFTGTMDYWDPAVTDGLARDREVILFNNAGVANSSGETPTSFQQMGANAIAFIRALGLDQVDVLLGQAKHLLGGKDHFTVDRDTMEVGLRSWPGFSAEARVIANSVFS